MYQREDRTFGYIEKRCIREESEIRIYQQNTSDLFERFKSFENDKKKFKYYNKIRYVLR